MDPNRYDPSNERNSAEIRIIEQLDADMNIRFGPLPNAALCRTQQYRAEIGQRLGWVADELGVELHFSTDDLAARSLHRIDWHRRAVESATRLTLLGLILDQLTDCEWTLRPVVEHARRLGITWTARDIRSLLERDAVVAFNRSEQFSIQPDGGLTADPARWITTNGHSIVERIANIRTEGEESTIQTWNDRFGGHIKTKWQNAGPELREDMLQESLIRLLRFERTIPSTGGSIGNVDGFRWTVMHNQAITEFNKDRTRLARTTRLTQRHFESHHLAEETILRENFEDPFEYLRLATAERGPISAIIATRPRNTHAPVLLDHLRTAVEAGLQSELCLIAQMEHHGLFGEDRTKDGTAYLDRIVWAAAHRRDRDYPADCLSSAHRPMRRVRRFVTEFLLPALRSVRKISTSEDASEMT